MRALVTGGAGFIGSVLANSLAERGDEVAVLDNLYTGRRDRLATSVRFIEADLRDGDAVTEACRGADVVFHLGAMRSVLRSVDDPVLTSQCNVGGTINVLNGAQASGARRVVFASSSSVYGDSTEELQREDALPRPISPYAASKLAGEHYCGAWNHLYGLSTVALRYFNVFGPGQDPESRYSNVIPAFLDALLQNRPPELHWDGEQIRDFTFIDDVIRATILAGEADERVDGRVLNIGGGHARSIIDVLRTVSDAVGKWIEPVRLERRAGDMRRTRADISSARELLGWEPTVPWDDAITRTVEWFVSHRAGGSPGR
jgi:UDP-glucose 4-epimerase